MSVLALIPARRGSKRIPGKNIVLLENKPLIAYTIEAAKAAQTVDRVIVSTDSKEIAKISESFGAEAPFRRPAEISGDEAREIDFYLHALDWLNQEEGFIPELIVTLYPTAPLRLPESIDRAVQSMLQHPEADSLRSVKLCSEHPNKMWLPEGEYLKPFVPEKDSNAHTLSYDLLPKTYVQNANIYITKPQTIYEKKSPVGDKVLSFVMDEVESLDINTPLDLEMAELLIRKRQSLV